MDAKRRKSCETSILHNALKLFLNIILFGINLVSRSEKLLHNKENNSEPWIDERILFPVLPHFITSMPSFQQQQQQNYETYKET